LSNKNSPLSLVKWIKNTKKIEATALIIAITLLQHKQISIIIKVKVTQATNICNVH